MDPCRFGLHVITVSVKGLARLYIGSAVNLLDLEGLEVGGLNQCVNV